ncbi:hypothetical protein GQ55_7G024800 [Panicum hallii var. hallii]|uniref:Uncharacterized protein n=1 Tax=Panicum hallii var. hallii TaxID=1504633 RepID=A0A2T7CS27_9POAL|nr:hypothetical protein GQ55_7G024800 [Panicum hallii var. hallii]
MLSSPVASDVFKSKIQAAGGAHQRYCHEDRYQQQQLKPRFALELDGLNCFETLVPR